MFGARFSGETAVRSTTPQKYEPVGDGFFAGGVHASAQARSFQQSPPNPWNPCVSEDFFFFCKNECPPVFSAIRKNRRALLLVEYALPNSGKSGSLHPPSPVILCIIFILFCILINFAYGTFVKIARQKRPRAPQYCTKKQIYILGIDTRCIAAYTQCINIYIPEREVGGKI